MQIRLFEAEKIAIPLKRQNDCPLNPEPNFLVIHSIFDHIKAPFPTPSGEFIEVDCLNSFMTLEYREILPAKNGKSEEIRKILMDNIGNMPIPEDFYLVFKNHERLIENEALINTYLPMFNFRGILEGYKLEYDKEKSQHYLSLKAMPPETIEVNPESPDSED